jgi:hypothetical protein
LTFLSHSQFLLLDKESCWIICSNVRCTFACIIPDVIYGNISIHIVFSLSLFLSLFPPASRQPG